MMGAEQEIIIRFVTLFIATLGAVAIIHGILSGITQIQRVLLALFWLIPLIIFEFTQIWEVIFPPELVIPQSAIHYVSAAIKLGAVSVITIYGSLFMIEKYIRDKDDT